MAVKYKDRKKQGLDAFASAKKFSIVFYQYFLWFRLYQQTP
ncbi:hypothetical protein MCEGEM3_01530 [Oxalobacteraceae bacterium]